MIERFNGRIAEVLATTRFDSAEHFADTIKRYVKVYNQHIPQKALGHSPPLQAMKNWSQKQTQLFKKCAYNLAGLNHYALKCIVVELVRFAGIRRLVAGDWKPWTDLLP